MRKDTRLLFQMINKETGVRSALLDATPSEYLEFIAAEIPADEQEGHYVIVWGTKEAGSEDTQFSSAPVMYVGTFTNMIKSFINSEETKDGAA